MRRTTKNKERQRKKGDKQVRRKRERESVGNPHLHSAGSPNYRNMRRDEEVESKLSERQTGKFFLTITTTYVDYK